jgi:hypothetical protein
MPLGSPKKRRGSRQVGARNKATLLTSAPAETLTEWEECRLEAYIKAMREVRVGPGRNRGSTNDFMQLAARSTCHRSVRGNLINTIREEGHPRAGRKFPPQLSFAQRCSSSIAIRCSRSRKLSFWMTLVNDPASR